MIAVICTDGQLNVSQMHKECVGGKWIPLLVLKERSTGTIHLPIFNIDDICKKFVARNLPKEWSKGCVHLTQEDANLIENKGWKYMLFDFPRKINEHPDYEMTFEIHEFDEQPDFMMSNYR
jgi:hypothetical protein